jgi:tRNA threonylcarbamoyladenosine biosynthesis protein TsaE
VGAGKSVFARAFIRSLMKDSALSVASPTFLLDNVYQTPEGQEMSDIARLLFLVALEELMICWFADIISISID